MIFDFVPVALLALSLNPTGLCRIAIVDDSGSMSGERAATVRSELDKFARQLPPSPDHPFVLVVFAADARRAKTFTDPARFSEAVSLLQGTGGGTNIASGLREATRFINGGAVHDVILMLYSDYKDANTDGIEAAEQALDALFAKRHKKGLANAVFVKTWNGESHQLQSLAGRPHVDLMDASDLDIQPLTIVPQLEVENLRRDPDEPGELHVTLKPRIDVRGSLDGQLPQVRLRCLIDSAVGDTDIEFDPRNPPDNLRLHLKLPQPHDTRAELRFGVTVRRPPPSSGRLILPQLAATNLQVPLKVPVLNVRNRVVAKIAFPRPPKWSDPRRLRAVFPLQITFTVTSEQTVAGLDQSTAFALEPLGACRLLAGDAQFTMPGPGSYPLDIELEASPVDPTAPLTETKFQIDFRIKPVRVPPSVRYEPAELVISEVLPPPDPLQVKLAVQIESVGTARWLQLPNLAVIEGVMRLDAAGSLPAGRPLALKSPDARLLQFAPTALTAVPAQRIAFRVVLPVRAAHDNPLQLDLKPGADPNSPWELITDGPIDIRFSGPPPLQLIDTAQGPRGESIRRRLWDNEQQISLDVRPELFGPAVEQFATGLRVHVRTNGVDLASPIPLGATTGLDLAVPCSDEQPFFHDKLEEIILELHPVGNPEIVRPGRLTLEIRRLAPFRRLLFYLTIAITAFLALIVIARIATKLTSSSP